MTFATAAGGQPIAPASAPRRHVLLIPLYFHAYARRTLDLDDIYSDPYLTDCEAESLYWASLGKSADIGEIVGSSEPAVKFHLKNVRAKYQVGTTPGHYRL